MTRFNEMLLPVMIPTSTGVAAHTTATTATPPSPRTRTCAVDKGPFYAVKMVLSDLGTCGGLQADERARVLREDGSAIDGLYAIGNTAANAFGATYPGAGATIAQGLVYGYIAARDAAAETSESVGRRSASAFFSTSCQNSGGGQGVLHAAVRGPGEGGLRLVEFLDHLQREFTLVGVVLGRPLQREPRVRPRGFGAGPLGVLRPPCAACSSA